MLYVVKKDGTREIFNVEKIVNAVNKSAARILYKFSKAEIQFICEFARNRQNRWARKILIFKVCTTLWRVLSTV